MRLRRSDCNSAGIRRRRAGRGFVYLDDEGERISDPALIARIEDLTIPPAWNEVWICPQENGHIQATGIDDAGRKQYLYHEKWSRTQASRKFETMLEFADALPALRRSVTADLSLGDPSLEIVLACAVRLIDLGHFRVGGERYAAENDTYGAATILKSHVSLGTDRRDVAFDYPGKGSIDRMVVVRDERVRAIAESLLRRRSGPDSFLVYRDGKQWREVTADQINAYIKAHSDERFSAKDFRTWNGTVIAAVSLATGGAAETNRARERQIRTAVAEVSDQLGNTPAVARSSYIDPRLFDLYRSGQTIQASSARAWRRSRNGLSAVERQVRELLGE